MEEKKKSKLIPIILMIVGIALIGGGVTLSILNKDNKDNKAKKEDNNEPAQTDRADDREVDEKLQKELLKIVFIDDEDTAKYSPLDGIDGYLSEVEISKQVEIIVNYANNNNMLSSADASKCPAGEGECKSITNEAINKVAALYTLQPSSIMNSELLNKSDDGASFYVRFKNNTTTSEGGMHSYFSMKMDDEIIISDSMHIMNFGENGDVISNKMINKEYMFRKLDNSSEYALYAVRDHSMIENMQNETGRDANGNTSDEQAGVIPSDDITNGNSNGIDNSNYPDGYVPGADGTSSSNYDPDMDPTMGQ